MAQAEPEPATPSKPGGLVMERTASASTPSLQYASSTAANAVVWQSDKQSDSTVYPFSSRVRAILRAEGGGGGGEAEVGGVEGRAGR